MAFGSTHHPSKKPDNDPNLAALNNHPQQVSDLVAAVARISLADVKGDTPLHLAAWTGASPQLWQALLRAGAEAQARDQGGRTPLQIVTRLYPALAVQIGALPELTAARSPG